MGSLTVRVEEATDYDVACALAKLAQFPKGSRTGMTNNVYEKEISKECAYVIHKETLEKAGGDWVEAMAYKGPDIISIQVHKYNPDVNDWKPTDDYKIFFNEEFVNHSLLDSSKIKAEIIAEYKRIGNERPKTKKSLKVKIMDFLEKMAEGDLWKYRPPSG